MLNPSNEIRQNLGPFIKRKRRKIKNFDKNHSISQKNFVFQPNEKGKNFERKKNTIRIEISFPEKPRMVFFF